MASTLGALNVRHAMLELVENGLEKIRKAMLTPISILFAAPKHRTTKSRRREIFRSHIPKDMKNIHSCPVCGNPKLVAHVCANCYDQYLKFVSEAEGNTFEKPKGYYFERLEEEKKAKLNEDIRLRRVTRKTLPRFSSDVRSYIKPEKDTAKKQE